ncbi:jg5035, partial [Pararge aegeria aegeria]
AIILTNTDEIKELELSKFFKDQVTVDNEKKKSAIILTNTDEIKELELSKFFKDQVTVDNEKKKS